MSDEHKAALAAGRAQGLAVKNYLEALESQKPRRGRPRTPEMVQQQIDVINTQIDIVPPMQRIALIQRRIDLLAALEEMSGPQVDIEELETEFVKVAAAYSQSKGISYAAWREFGVESAVLKKAGLTK